MNSRAATWLEIASKYRLSAMMWESFMEQDTEFRLSVAAVKGRRLALSQARYAIEMARRNR